MYENGRAAERDSNGKTLEAGIMQRLYELGLLLPWFDSVIVNRFLRNFAYW